MYGQVAGTVAVAHTQYVSWISNAKIAALAAGPCEPSPLVNVITKKRLLWPLVRVIAQMHLLSPLVRVIAQMHLSSPMVRVMPKPRSIIRPGVLVLVQ